MRLRAMREKSATASREFKVGGLLHILVYLELPSSLSLQDRVFQVISRRLSP